MPAFIPVFRWCRSFWDSASGKPPLPWTLSDHNRHDLRFRQQPIGVDGWLRNAVLSVFVRGYFCRCLRGWAGIAGISVAYLLSQENRSVVVVDDGNVGG